MTVGILRVRFPDGGVEVFPVEYEEVGEVES